MSAPLQSLIAALRDELQQYGEMLALLDREQELVMHRAGLDLLETVSAIQAHAAVIQAARNQRDDCRAKLAASLGETADTSISGLIPRLPPDYQPLLEALVRENNQLLTRVQQRARQNHLLLSRSLEMMQRFMSTLFPTRDLQVYDDHGHRQTRTQILRPVYEAVG